MESGTLVVLMIAELLGVLGLLLLADRWLHRHLQGVLFLLTNDQEIALWLYALLLFPGVLVHELSHALAATILGVRIGRISLFPRREKGHIQLGFVPVEETDILRASLIGAAPLFSGTLLIFGIGYFVFGSPEVIAALSAGDWLAAMGGLVTAVQAPDAWVWAALIFAVGNTMLPSRSDTHAWPLLGLILVLLLGVAMLAGAGSALLTALAGFLTWGVRWVVLLGGSTLLVDLPFFFVLFLVEKLLEQLRGRKIRYQ